MTKHAAGGKPPPQPVPPPPPHTSPHPPRSYVFAFYMFGGEMFSEDISADQNEINKALFEDKQAQLEIEVGRGAGWGGGVGKGCA